MKDTLRVVVVGASSGLGRCIATGLGQRGASVALLARRADRLADAAKEAGDHAIAVACDVTETESCAAAIEQAVDAFDGIDALVYTPAIGPLQRLIDVDAATWQQVFQTNVIGAALMTAAAMPHLTASRGAAAYLSSISASETPPWPGLAAYAVSKAALDKLVEAWRAEHPAVGFTRIVVGDCVGGEGPAMTEFSSGWDMELATEFLNIWAARQYLSGSLMDVEELVNVVDTVLRTGASAFIPSVSVVPRRPA